MARDVLADFLTIGNKGAYMDFLKKIFGLKILLCSIFISVVIFQADATQLHGLSGDINATTNLGKTRSTVKAHINCALTLEHYRFSFTALSQESFKAALTLFNKSGTDIELEMISHCGEDKPIQVILRNQNDEILWEYIHLDPLIGCPDFGEKFTLKNNRSLRHTVNVPLIIDRAPLIPGEYKLEAFIDGRPKFGAFAPLQIE